MRIQKRRGETSLWTYVGLTAVALLVLTAIGIFNPSNIPKGQNPFAVTSVQTTSSAGTNLCAAALPIQFTVLDALAGTAVNAPTMNIYAGTVGIRESPTVSASGVATTGGSYPTGTNLIIKLSGASLVTTFLPIVVPPITCGSSQTNNIMTIYGITLGAWTITAAGGGGTTFTSGVQYFLSQLPAGASGTNTITLSFSQNTNNQGYKTSVDIVNSLVQNMVIEIKDTSTGLSVSGLPRSQTVGTTRYWQVVCGDGLSGQGYGTGTTGAFAVTTSGTSTDSLGPTTVNPLNGQALSYPSTGLDSACAGTLTLQKVGNNVYGGVASFGFGVSKGSLASGSSETLSITMNSYSSLSYFASQTTYGPNTAAQGAPQGSSAGTAFSLLLMNG